MDIRCEDSCTPTKKNFATINPCKMCQPMGAVYALLGVQGAMPLIHGSQGCSTYMRFQLCRHFREPINIASSSMHEDAAVYGGEKNLYKALKNMIEVYNPKLIGVITSCLTETIGDNIEGIIKTFKEAQSLGDETKIVPIHTPSYVGSHIHGYDNAIKSLVKYLAKKSEPNNKINVIPGYISPADVRELKNILEIMKCGGIILTDISDNLDAPMTGFPSFLPEYGTTIEDIADSVNSQHTISLLNYAASAAVFLKDKYNVPMTLCPLPIGLQNTDIFVNNIAKLTNQDIPKDLQNQRGRLLDAMVDSHYYNYGRKVAIYGEPDLVVGITRFVCELGMIPAVVCTGTHDEKFIRDMKIIAKDLEYDPVILSGGDLYDLHQYVKKLGVELLIGNSYGARIAKAENIPLIRVGFPIYDKLGAQRISVVGYNGAIQLVDRITNTIIERYYGDEI